MYTRQKTKKSIYELIKKQCFTKDAPFIDNDNINLGMLNKSGLHVSENHMNRLVNNFLF